MIISIDFDGTIVEDNYPQIGPIKANVSEVINQLKQDGHYLILNTCRTNGHLLEAINFCLENAIVFDRINDNIPGLTAKYGATRKIYADVYIDDHNIGELPEWKDIRDWVIYHEVEPILKK